VAFQPKKVWQRYGGLFRQSTLAKSIPLTAMAKVGAGLMQMIEAGGPRDAIWVDGERQFEAK
jgi:hypothetical protein